MRVGVDATPLLGRPTGVGRYVNGLLAGLTVLPDAPDVLLTAFTWRGFDDVPRLRGTSPVGRRAPARLLQAAWLRFPVPRLEWLGVDCEVFHATNYVLPPSGRAAGVLSVHDLSFARHADTVDDRVLLFRRLVPRGLARARVVLTLTEALADEVAEHYLLDRSRVRAARPGVDPAWLTTEAPTPEWRAERDLPDRYLVFVGTLEPRKNLPVLLDALARLGPAAPTLVLAGPVGWGRPVGLGTLGPDSVRWLGYTPDDVLRKVVAGATLLVYPSRHEGFGLPPLEALACGTPVVSSDLPALREVTGPHATYVPVGDADALAEAIADRLATEPTPGDRERWRAHAAQWTWRRCAEEALAGYRLAADLAPAMP